MTSSCFAFAASRFSRSFSCARIADALAAWRRRHGAVVIGMNEADVDISGIQTQISYPDVADFAVAGEGKFSTSGVNASFDFFWFRSGKVFVYIYSLSLSNEKQTLEPLAREVLNKLNTYSQ